MLNAINLIGANGYLKHIQPVLFIYLQSESYKIHDAAEKAIRELKEFVNPDFVDYLITEITYEWENETHCCKTRTLELLTQLEDNDTVRKIVERLISIDITFNWMHNFDLKKLICEFANDSTASYLRRLISEGNSELKKIAISCIGTLKLDAFYEDLVELLDNGEFVPDVLTSLSKLSQVSEILPVVRSFLDSSNKELVDRAILLLSYHGSKTDFEKIFEFIYDDNIMFERIQGAMLQQPHLAPVQHIIKYISNHRGKYVSETIIFIEFLGEHFYEQSLDVMKSILDNSDENSEIRVAAMRMIAKSINIDSIKIISQYIEDFSYVEYTGTISNVAVDILREFLDKANDNELNTILTPLVDPNIIIKNNFIW